MAMSGSQTRLPRQLLISRAMALVGAPVVIVGETARRWHQFGEPRMWPSIFDDYVIGIALVIGAAWVTREARRGRVALGAAWGIAIGIGYSSVFGHMRSLDQADPSGLPHVVVFGVIAGLWLAAIVGLLLTVAARE